MKSVYTIKKTKCVCLKQIKPVRTFETGNVRYAGTSRGEKQRQGHMGQSAEKVRSFFLTGAWKGLVLYRRRGNVFNFKKNCCDGIYNSFDIHFTSLCDNKCKHCIDMQFAGLGLKRPNVDAIIKTIINNQNGYDDVLFLGGEPCLFLEEMYDCIIKIKKETKLKVFVTTAVPRVCYDKRELFFNILKECDGMNLSVQHNDETIADHIRCTVSKYDRQKFYNGLPMKEKIRINLNIVKPHLHTKRQITECLLHYDKMGFNSIKLSEIQHGEEYYTSFEKTFNLEMGSPFYHGCQTYLKMNKIIPGFRTPVLLKRSCFMCEETLKASFMDGIKVLNKWVNPVKNNKYGVIYGDGTLSQGWR
jgi:organic radical activating enzyme